MTDHVRTLDLSDEFLLESVENRLQDGDYFGALKMLNKRNEMYAPSADAEAFAADPEAMLIGGEEREELLALLQNSLSPVEWRALLAYAEGLRIAEIAEREKIGAKSAENAVQRAKKKMQKLLAARKG